MLRDLDRRFLTKRSYQLELLQGLLALDLLHKAAGEYYYDTENVKRWILGSGGKSGNCEVCEGNADLGWIPDDDIFERGIDGPPAHPHCGCTLEYGEKRVRVYI